jgi:hypothetical protein
MTIIYLKYPSTASNLYAFCQIKKEIKKKKKEVTNAFQF